MTVDSGSYVTLADGIRSGDGPTSPVMHYGEPYPDRVEIGRRRLVTHFPPLYPAVIAVFAMATGLDTIDAARWLGASLLAITIAWVTVLVGRRTGRSARGARRRDGAEHRRGPRAARWCGARACSASCSSAPCSRPSGTCGRRRPRRALAPGRAGGRRSAHPLRRHRPAARRRPRRGGPRARCSAATGGGRRRGGRAGRRPGRALDRDRGHRSRLRFVPLAPAGGRGGAPWVRQHRRLGRDRGRAGARSSASPSWVAAVVLTVVWCRARSRGLDGLPCARHDRAARGRGDDRGDRASRGCWSTP